MDNKACLHLSCDNIFASSQDTSHVHLGSCALGARIHQNWHNLMNHFWHFYQWCFSPNCTVTAPNCSHCTKLHAIWWWSEPFPWKFGDCVVWFGEDGLLAMQCDEVVIFTPMQFMEEFQYPRDCNLVQNSIWWCNLVMKFGEVAHSHHNGRCQVNSHWGPMWIPQSW